MVALLRGGPYLHQERNAAAWRAIIRDEAAVRELLGGNLFLRLSLDTERGLAFIENAPLEEARRWSAGFR